MFFGAVAVVFLSYAPNPYQWCFLPESKLLSVCWASSVTGAHRRPEPPYSLSNCWWTWTKPIDVPLPLRTMSILWTSHAVHWHQTCSDTVSLNDHATAFESNVHLVNIACCALTSDMLPCSDTVSLNDHEHRILCNDIRHAMTIPHPYPVKLISFSCHCKFVPVNLNLIVRDPVCCWSRVSQMTKWQEFAPIKFTWPYMQTWNIFWTMVQSGNWLHPITFAAVHSQGAFCSQNFEKNVK